MNTIQNLHAQYLLGEISSEEYEKQEADLMDYTILKRGLMNTDDRFEVMLIKDKNGYCVFTSKMARTFEYGYDYETAEKHFKELVIC